MLCLQTHTSHGVRRHLTNQPNSGATFSMPHIVDLFHTFRHEWKDVFLASWRKYPSPKRPDILSVDILNKEFDPQSGVLTTTRLIIAEGYVPVWLRSVRTTYCLCFPVLVPLGVEFKFPSRQLFGGNVIMFVEETRVDPKNKKMTLYSRNLTFDNVLKTEETCTYTPEGDHGLWTKLKQTCKVSIIGGLMSGAAEEYMVKKFSANANKGREIMESAIQVCESEHTSDQ